MTRAPREKGPTVGEYFFYTWLNRLVAPRSKRALTQWYRHTAIQAIRPVALEELTSQRYWEKWNRVGAEEVEAIGRAFFARVWQLSPSSERGMWIMKRRHRGNGSDE